MKPGARILVMVLGNAKMAKVGRRSQSAGWDASTFSYETMGYSGPRSFGSLDTADEGTMWARGWRDDTAAALRAAHNLSERPSFEERIRGVTRR